AGGNEVLRRKVVARRGIGLRFACAPDTAFGGDQHLPTHGRHFFESLSQNAFCFTLAVNVRVIEETVTGLESSNDRLAPGSPASRCDFGRIPTPGHSPAPISEATASKRADS